MTLPHILGSDIAGEVVESGEYITDVKPGTRVLLAPMVFCNHCEQCMAGIRTSVRSSRCWAIRSTAAIVS